MARTVLVLAALIASGCSSFSEVADSGIEAGGDGPVADGPATDSGPPADGPATDSGPPADGPPPGDLPPLKKCRPIPLPCLDPAPMTVIEVPKEATAAQAFAQAKAGDTIQIKGGSLSSGKVPAYVTLRGCDGAQLVGNISFAGSGGTVEGFQVSGQVIANLTGAYTIRYNRFSGGASHGVSARSIDALVSASVVAVVEGNWFEKQTYGVQAATNYDTMTHQVEITIRNNVFTGVGHPIAISEGGMVGKITATIEHNTIHDFTTGISLSGVDAKTTTRGNLLVKGTKAVSGNSVYDASYSALWQVDQVGIPPFGGTFATTDPAFASPATGDLRPGPASAVVDAIPQSAPMPSDDYHGCPRPMGFKGTAALGDIGAIELQK